jgi:hypothetical protein
VERFEQIMGFFDLDDKAKIEALALKLTGAAKSWYDNLSRADKLDWLAFRRSLLLRTSSSAARASYHDTFNKMEQLPSDSARTYYGKLKETQTAANKAAVAVAETIILHRLRDAELLVNQYTRNYTQTDDPIQQQIYREAIKSMELVIDRINMAIPGRITDEQVRTQWRNHCLPRISTYIRYEYDPNGKESMDALLERATNQEQKLKEEGINPRSSTSMSTSSSSSTQGIVSTSTSALGVGFGSVPN